MDGRGRCNDNIWIERFWRTIKQEYVYIYPTDSVAELHEGIWRLVVFYAREGLIRVLAGYHAIKNARQIFGRIIGGKAKFALMLVVLCPPHNEPPLTTLLTRNKEISTDSCLKTGSDI